MSTPSIWIAVMLMVDPVTDGEAHVGHRLALSGQGIEELLRDISALGRDVLAGQGLDLEGHVPDLGREQRLEIGVAVE
jgi:hypothetical protein